MKARSWGTWFALGWLVVSCGEGRKLELFPRSKPAPETPCGETARCPPHAPSCVAGQCVECVSDPDCKMDRPVCVAGACVACVSNADCPGQACNVATLTCTKLCTGAAECDRREAPICDAVREYCVECVSSEDCKAPRGTCEPVLGICVDCAEPARCAECTACEIDAGDQGATASGDSGKPAE